MKTKDKPSDIETKHFWFHLTIIKEKKKPTHWNRENIKTKIEEEERHRKKKSPKADASALVVFQW